MSIAALSDILRRIHNVVRTGTIAEVDLASTPALVRVQLVDEDGDSAGVRTDWRPWLELRAGSTATWNPPTVGEQVVLLSPSGELAGAIVLSAIASQTHPAPSADPGKHLTRYPDGATVEYDHASHALAINLPAGGKATVSAPAEVHLITDRATLDASHTDIKGSCTVHGAFAYQSGMTGQGGAGGAASAVIRGTVQFEDAVITANGKRIDDTHTHGGVETGGGQSGAVS